MYLRVFHFLRFLDVILGCLTKDVVGQYKVNAKKIDFYLMTCPSATPCHFRQFWAKMAYVILARPPTTKNLKLLGAKMTELCPF